ncbi:PKD-like family lipoprotein [Aestuariibaculum suncheonense]|uniref:PKD family protein n=1 Tax=Aestuariibaculum suncheonense TaxID=1028745 RepID=A0A8J6Q8Y1_9FLAO|nr:PKD-like family lipoprotein [Aestuariibaculum suncheonense]MBD0835435.1 hypothetical protein [Aestuariibaculum suncheonense]
MKKIIYILSALLFASCYEDTGNYNYTEIEDITIEEVPSQLGDLILIEDTIKINPVVGPKAEFDNNNFNYYWSLKEGTGGSAKLVRFAFEKDLVMPVTLAGDITLMFEVEHKETGIINYQIVNARGVSKFSNGMYLLKETSNGKTDIDMIGLDSQTGEPTTYPNLISVLNNGTGLDGTPVTIDYWGYRKEDYENAQLVAVPALRIASKEDIMVIDTNEFGVLGQFEDLFLGDVPAVRNIQNLKSINGNTTLINDGKVYAFSNYSNGIVAGEVKEYGGNKFLPALVGDYYMDNDIAWAARDQANTFLMYNTVDGHFKYTITTASEPRDVREYPGFTDFKQDFNANLLFMESIASGIYGYNVYALLQNKQDPEVLTMLDINAQNINGGYVRLNSSTSLAASDYRIDDASMWCVHQHRKQIYFVADNKIWKYDAVSKTEQMIKEFPGEEITHIDVLNEWYTVTGGIILQLEYTDFIVATSTGNNYKLYKFDMAAGDIIESEPYFTSTGEGKVTDYIYIKPSTTPFWMRTKY